MKEEKCKLISEFCKKPKEEGRCNSNIIRWYFDKEKGCKSFKYSGCDGNENNFPTEQDCKKVCDDYQSKFPFVIPFSLKMKSTTEPITTRNYRYFKLL